MFNKPIDPVEFWKDYEKNLGEKVLGYCLGRYLSGWDRYPGPLWGLNIVTSAAYRFHHFPHEGWLEALTRVTRGGKIPEEKVIEVPKNRILGAAFMREEKLFKRFFFNIQPWLSLKYQREDGTKAELIVESDIKAKALAELLSGIAKGPDSAAPGAVMTSSSGITPNAGIASSANSVSTNADSAARDSAGL